MIAGGAALRKSQAGPEFLALDDAEKEENSSFLRGIVCPSKVSCFCVFLYRLPAIF